MEPWGSRKSHQPKIPPAQDTPGDWWWDGHGFIQQRLGRECPPWLPGVKPGHGGCKRDAVNLAVRYIRPGNRCGAGGRCSRGGQYASCVTYNSGKFYPEYNRAGFCITTGPCMRGKHQISYVEKTIVNNMGTAQFYLKAMHWAQRDSPARLTCDSFCKKCDKKTEYCPDTADSPIASGEFGSCGCYCRAGSEAADFDRCTTVSAAVCAQSYCGTNGEGSFTPTVGAEEGTCECGCKTGFYGRNCELKKGDACDINDCNHRSNGASGTRPDCKCDCGGGKFNFAGPTCVSWTFGNNPGGKYPTSSMNFTVQRSADSFQGFKRQAQEGGQCRCHMKWLFCKKRYKGGVGCVGDTIVQAGPEKYAKNRRGLVCKNGRCSKG